MSATQEKRLTYLVGSKVPFVRINFHNVTMPDQSTRGRHYLPGRDVLDSIETALLECTSHQLIRLKREEEANYDRYEFEDTATGRRWSSLVTVADGSKPESSENWRVYRSEPGPFRVDANDTVRTLYMIDALKYLNGLLRIIDELNALISATGNRRQQDLDDEEKPVLSIDVDGIAVTDPTVGLQDSITALKGHFDEVVAVLQSTLSITVETGPYQHMSMKHGLVVDNNVLVAYIKTAESSDDGCNCSLL